MTAKIGVKIVGTTHIKKLRMFHYMKAAYVSAITPILSTYVTGPRHLLDENKLRVAWHIYYLNDALMQ